MEHLIKDLLKIRHDTSNLSTLHRTNVEASNVLFPEAFVVSFLTFEWNNLPTRVKTASPRTSFHTDIVMCIFYR